MRISVHVSLVDQHMHQQQAHWQKVLHQASYYHYKHEALLCFWEPLHHKGELEAFFEVEVVSDAFKKLKVFSMSNYVSELLKTTETLEVEMADADARIDWLQKLYG